MTLTPGICDTLLIRLSVIPSLKYSALGSPPALTNGSTARESIVPALGRSQSTAAASAASATTPAAHTRGRKARDRGGCAAGVAGVVAEPLEASPRANAM